MRQFDIVENPNPSTARYSPYLVVLQSHHLNPLGTVVLAPLLRDAKRTMSVLDIDVEFEGERLVLAIAEAAGVSRRAAGRTVGSLAEREDEIRRALERLLSGF